MTLNFQKRFAGAVKNGRKRQTIRPRGKRTYEVGQVLHCFTGLRQKGAKFLRRAKIEEVRPIGIGEYGTWLGEGHDALTDGEEFDLAVADGFKNTAEFREFFRRTHGLPFFGTLIQW